MNLRGGPTLYRYLGASVLLIVGAVSITFGLTRVGSTWFVVVGVAAGLSGVWIIHDTLFNESRGSEWTIGRDWLVALGGWALYLVPIGVLYWFDVMPAFAIVALAGLSAVGLGVLAAGLRSLCGRKSPRRGIGIVGVALTIVGLFGVVLAGDSDAWFLLSFATLFLGVVAWGFALVVSCGASTDARWWALGSAIALVVSLAVAGLLAAAEVDPLWLLLPAGAGGIALIPLSQATPRLLKAGMIRFGAFRLVAIAVIGAAVGATLALVSSGADWSLDVTIVVVAVLGLIAVAYVADVAALAVYALVVLALAGVMIDRTGGAIAEDGGKRLVVFGDSYISGEGAYEFLEGTNVAVSDEDSTLLRNECRLSASAYPNLLAERKNWTLETYACSGARSYDVARLARGPATGKRSTQLDQFHANGGANGAEIGAVLISIGGNDAWFGAVGQACLGPGSCEVHRDAIMRNLAVVGNRVGQVFRAVKEAVGYPDVPVYAVPYPLVMTSKGCADSPLTNAEQEFLFEFSEILNDTIRAEAEKEGVNWVVSATVAHSGHRMCESGELSINLVDVLPKEGPLSARLIPTNWVKGSAHPHEDGHRLTYDAIKSVFEGELTNPMPDEEAVAEIKPRTATVSRGALGIPAHRGCGDEDVPVSLTVRAVTTGTKPQLILISESSPLCTNRPNGGWVRWETYDSERDASWGTDESLAVPEAERPDFHWITYQTDGGRWIALVYQYCDLRSDCVNNASELTDWMQQEIEAVVRSSVVPAALVFAAWWFGFVWIKKRWL